MLLASISLCLRLRQHLNLIQYPHPIQHLRPIQHLLKHLSVEIVVKRSEQKQNVTITQKLAKSTIINND